MERLRVTGEQGPRGPVVERRHSLKGKEEPMDKVLRWIDIFHMLTLALCLGLRGIPVYGSRA